MKDKKILKQIMVTGAVMLSSFLLRKAIEGSYKMVRSKDAPKDPALSGVSLGKALVWTVTTGALISITKTLIRPYLDMGVNKMVEQ